MTKNFMTYGRYRMMYYLMPVLFFNVFQSCNVSTYRNLYATLKGEIFGTTYSINIASDKEVDLEVIGPGVDSLLGLIDLTFSTYADSTLLTFFNDDLSYSGLTQKLGTRERSLYAHQLLARCLRISQDAYNATSGALDPTAGQLFNIWGFAEGKFTDVPDSQTVQQALEAKGLDRISTVKGPDSLVHLVKDHPDPRLRLNFNAVAKGLAVDEVAAYLEKNGVKNYTVEIGGEMRISGNKLSGEKWVIGINKPLRGAGVKEALLHVSPDSTGLATSGNYRNYFEANGRLYAHIIDPRTGYPAATDLLSATVFHPECGVADAYATAFMVMGAQRSKTVADSLGLEYIFIKGMDGSTSGFEVLLSPKASSWASDK